MWSSLCPSCLGLCASWTCKSISFIILGKFFFIIFSNKFSISYSFSSPSSSPMIWMLAHLKLSQRLLILSSFWGDSFFLLAILIEYFFLPYVPNHSFDSQLHPLNCKKKKHWFPVISVYREMLVPCKFFFISLSIIFISACIFLMLLKYPMISLSLLITSVLNSTSDHLLISILFSSFSGVLFCPFIWAMFLFLLILAASLCLFLCIR